ncbi:MAG TPA: neutral/alkaline non-lysosomal ceramidase N-terminal domain-containing protein, partial [Pyrinomonadaceae bacterium]|nr:neutral/alkaline non-lysosomal ceramidase N-terminal domain-containing protein [Pyrinomonadaceae bacterium]
MFKAGFSKQSISPPIGAPLAGFAARQGVCEGIHDELFSRALVLENNDRSVAIVSLDVLAVSAEFVEKVRSRIESKTGLKKDAIMIAATHTHAGPVTIRTFFNPDESLDSDYMNSLADAIENSVVAAWENKFGARIGVGSGHVDGIGVNRRTEDKKPIDDEIGIIKIEDATGAVKGVLINYSCHPTVLGSDNLLATGDFPYFAVDTIEEELGDGGFAMFVNGTQGNISMGHSSELSAIGIITPGRTFEHAAELGEKLGRAAIDAMKEIQTTDAAKLDTSVANARFPLKELPEIPAAEAAFVTAEKHLADISSNGASSDQIMKAKSGLLYASITDYYAKETSKFSDGTMPIELQALRIDDAVFLAVPAEVFVEIGLEIKKRAGRKTFIVGIANGYIGYLPTATSYPAGGYEVVSSKVSPET